MMDLHLSIEDQHALHEVLSSAAAGAELMVASTEGEARIFWQIRLDSLTGILDQLMDARA